MTKAKPKEFEIPTTTERALTSLNNLRDAIGEITDEDRETLVAWEKMIKSHSLRKDWIAHPITQEVFRKLLDEVVDIDRKLSTDEEMLEATRRAIFKGKQAFLWLLTLFSDAKDDTVLATLAEEIESRTESFKNYSL